LTAFAKVRLASLALTAILIKLPLGFSSYVTAVVQYYTFI